MGEIDINELWYFIHNERSKKVVEGIVAQFKQLESALAERNTRIRELERQLAIGNEEGDVCNRRCTGKMELEKTENCSCHIYPPCSACVSNRPVCSMCGEESG